MSQYTLAEAQAKWAEWMACNQALAVNQSYTIGDKTFTRADGDTVLEQLQYWQGQVYLAEQSAGGVTSPRFTYASFHGTRR